MFRLKRDMASEMIKELILPNRQRRYDLGNNPDFAVPMVKSVHKGKRREKDLSAVAEVAGLTSSNLNKFTIFGVIIS